MARAGTANRLTCVLGMHAAFRTYVKPSRFVVEELYENQRGSGLVGPRSFSAHGTIHAPPRSRTHPCARFYKLLIVYAAAGGMRSVDAAAGARAVEHGRGRVPA